MLFAFDRDCTNAFVAITTTDRGSMHNKCVGKRVLTET